MRQTKELACQNTLFIVQYFFVKTHTKYLKWVVSKFLTRICLSVMSVYLALTFYILQQNYLMSFLWSGYIVMSNTVFPMYVSCSKNWRKWAKFNIVRMWFLLLLHHNPYLAIWQLFPCILFDSRSLMTSALTAI